MRVTYASDLGAFLRDWNERACGFDFDLLIVPKSKGVANHISEGHHEEIS